MLGLGWEEWDEDEDEGVGVGVYIYSVEMIYVPVGIWRYVRSIYSIPLDLDIDL